MKIKPQHILLATGAFFVFMKMKKKAGVGRSNLFSSSEISKLINQYLNLGGYITEIEEGSLGHGNLIISAPGYKHVVVKEIYLNEWSSAHTVRFYNKLPKKYENLA